MYVLFFFFFQAEDGIRDAQESRVLGDVYKRQDYRGIERKQVNLTDGQPFLRLRVIQHEFPRFISVDINLNLMRHP